MNLRVRKDNTAQTRLFSNSDRQSSNIALVQFQCWDGNSPQVICSFKVCDCCYGNPQQ